MSLILREHYLERTGDQNSSMAGIIASLGMQLKGERS